MIDEKLFKKLSFFAILLVLIILTLVIIKPIASAAISGLILAYIFYPIYKKILPFVKEKNISAIIVILLVIFIIFLPIWFLLPFVLNQLFDVYLYIQKLNIFDLIKNASPYLTEINISKDLTISLNSVITNFAGKFFSFASSMFLNLPSLLLKMVIMLFIFFFGMRDGKEFVEYLFSLLPFSKSTEKLLIEKFKGITNAVIYGFIVIGIVQGLLTGFGLFVLQINNYIVLTLLAIVASIIPILGAWIVWIPIVIYLFIKGNTIQALILLAYCSIVVSWIDNIIRPYLVAKQVKISSAIVLIGMIGGLIVFGILGLILGPLILAYLLLFLDAYKDKKLKKMFY